MADVYYNILLMMAKVFQLGGIFTSAQASEKDTNENIENIAISSACSPPHFSQRGKFHS